MPASAKPTSLDLASAVDREAATLHRALFATTTTSSSSSVDPAQLLQALEARSKALREEMHALLTRHFPGEGFKALDEVNKVSALDALLVIFFHPPNLLFCTPLL